MMFARLVKKEEGVYTLSSVQCPGCKTHLTLEVSSDKVFAMNQGALVTEVIGDQSPDVRERFISGICGSCWDLMFSVSELDEEEME